jgi:uncharacterized protein (TIGR02679 family)
MIYASDRLRTLLTTPALGRLMERLQARMRQGRRLDAPVAIPSLTREERSAIDSLLNRRPSSGNGISVRPSEIERILVEAQLCDSLEEALIHVFGPVANERQVREEDWKRWLNLKASTAAECSALPEYHSWLDLLFSKGKLKRLCKNDCICAAQYLQVAASVLRGIPWPVVSLAELATRLTGDSHALDGGMPMSHLCLSAIASQHPQGADKLSRRQLWEWAGVVVDELSAPVLVLNLRGDQSNPIGRVLNCLADAGEPCHLSVRLLRSGGATVFDCMAGTTVYACENPSVVAAAVQRLGRASRSLICTAGQPASAAQLLLSLLRKAGCRILYHGDFDSAGITIANLLIQRFDVKPWRMAAADYATVHTKGPALVSKCGPAIWDEQLADVIRAKGHAVLEESVLDSLICDLLVTGS